MNEVLQDLRYAVRTLRKSPGFATVAVLTLAIGIGANTAIFSFVNGVLLKPLPYGEPERIVRVLEKPPGGGRNGISTLNYLDWQKDNTVFDYMAAQTGGSVTLTGINEPVQLRGSRVSPHYFDIFGIKPAFGRTFAADEDQVGKERVAVLSHALWDSQFGADPNVVGRTITLDGVPHTVIGRAAGGRRVRPGIRADLAAAGVRATEHDAQLPLVRRPCQIEAGSHVEAGHRSDGYDRRPNREGLSGFEQGMGRVDRAVRGHGGRHAAASIAVRAAVRGGNGSADRLREPGQPDAGARHGAGA